MLFSPQLYVPRKTVVLAAAGAVTVDANPAASQRSATGQTSFTYTGLTSTASANCIVALMNLELAPGASVTSVTWDSAGANQAFTSLGLLQDGGGGGQSHLEIWALLAPGSSGNKNIDVVWTGSTQIMMAGISLIGVNGTFATAFPSGSRTNGTIGSTTSPSFNVTSAANHIALGMLANRGNNFSAPTGGTAIFTDNGGSGSNGAAQWGNGAATVTFGWTDDASDIYGFVGCDVSP